MSDEQHIPGPREREAAGMIRALAQVARAALEEGDVDIARRYLDDRSHEIRQARIADLNDRVAPNRAAVEQRAAEQAEQAAKNPPLRNRIVVW